MDYARFRTMVDYARFRAMVDYARFRAMVDYARLRAMGLEIGSGRVESACKHVVAARLKRGGMRWSRAGSQAVLSLRTTWLNGQWQPLRARHRLARAA